jgi:hypothetical protein
VGGYDLVALIFVREIDAPLTSLVKDIDKRLHGVPARNQGHKLGVWVVVCNDNEAAKQQARDLVSKEGLQHVVVGTTAPGGPPRYRVNPDAEQTVVIYNGEGIVVANFALQECDLDEAKTAEIIKALARVVPIRTDVAKAER